MRLATFNLLHGRSLTDGLVDPARLAEAVRRIDADVLAIQEVDRGQPRSGGLDLTALVAEAVGAVAWRFEPALVGTPGGQWHAAGESDREASGPAYGVGLVSRLPVERWEVVRLPAAPIRSPVMLPGSRRLLWLRDEPRIGLAAVLVGAPVRTIATTHLSFVPGWNGFQLRTLVRRLGALPGPRVLLGDLNLPGSLPARLSRWRSLARVKTYPGASPSVQLDHALADGLAAQVRRVETLALPVSDHCALIVEVTD